MEIARFLVVSRRPLRRLTDPLKLTPPAPTIYLTWRIEMGSMETPDAREEIDERRLQLARRLLRHCARTGTVRAWTGMSADRVRKIYRRCISRTANGRSRPCGAYPIRVSYFFSTKQLEREVAWLSSLLILLDAIPSKDELARNTIEAKIARAEKICQSFETYCSLVPNPQISFERTLLLTGALARSNRLLLNSCPNCGALKVTETALPTRIRCVDCR
jgi:hypothetical protein